MSAPNPHSLECFASYAYVNASKKTGYMKTPYKGKISRVYKCTEVLLFL